MLYIRRFYTALCYLVLFIATSSMAQPIYQVTTDNDPVNPFSTVPGELRWAINQVNTSGSGVIVFNIPGTAPHVIELQTPLPSIVGKITIDGNTQPANGYTGIEPKIELQGSNTDPSMTSGLVLSYIDTVTVQHSGGSIIKNLSIHHFYNDGIFVGFPFDITIKNNVIHSIGDHVSSTGSGINLFSGFSNITIQGNVIGTTRSGTSNLGCDMGIILGGTDGLFANGIIGGTSLGMANTIANSQLQGGCYQTNFAFSNTISGNIMYNNYPKGIVLNFPLVIDTIFQSPDISSATIGNGTASVQGQFNSFPLEFVFPKFVEVFLSNATGTDALHYLGTAMVDSVTQQWKLNGITLKGGEMLIAIQTSKGNQTSEFGAPYRVPCPSLDVNLCSEQGTNFVEYGDFSGLTPGSFPFTSDYSYRANAADLGPGDFTIGTEAPSNLGMTGRDHTTGNGEYMIIRGKGTGTSESANKLWVQTVCGLTPGKPYELSFYGMNLGDVEGFIFNLRISTSTSPFVDIVSADFLLAPHVWKKVSAIATADGSGCIQFIIRSTLNSNLSRFGIGLDDIAVRPACEVCKNSETPFIVKSSVKLNSSAFAWNFGDGATATALNTTHSYTATGNYTAKLTVTVSATSCTLTASRSLVVTDCDLPCVDCIGSFAPTPGKAYVLSAWVKEEGASPSKLTYDHPEIYVKFPNLNDSIGPFTAKGQIIEGWQRIEVDFTIPSGATSIDLKLKSTTGNSFFDDIRVHPFDGSMKSFVFDPVTLRLSAELDERNYATLYEYDEEGKQVRVKKETERGVMTVTESRMSKKKQ